MEKDFKTLPSCLPPDYRPHLLTQKIESNWSTNTFLSQPATSLICCASDVQCDVSHICTSVCSYVKWNYITQKWYI